MELSRKPWRTLLAVIFIGSGINHFWHPVSYLVAMPPYLPWPNQLIAISGALAILLGFLLLVPKVSRVAAWGLIAWLIAVFPAHVHLVANAYLYSSFLVMLLWLRLPIQFLLIMWAFRYTKPDSVNLR